MRRLLLTAGLFLALATPASATITIGSTDPATFTDSPGPSQLRTVLQTAGGTYVVPPGTWVVKSVSARLTTTMFASASVRFARPQNGSYLWLGHEPFEDLPDNATSQVFTASASRAVRGGDLIGLTYNPGVGALSDNAAGFTYGYTGADTVDGDEEPLTPGPTTGAYAISATLEPDADGDGYGDETEDACIRDAERQAPPCATDVKIDMSVAATTIIGGNDTGVSMTATNLGPEPAINVRIQLPYGQRFFHRSFAAPCESLPVQTFCSLGTIAPGASVNVSGTFGSFVVGSDVTEAMSSYVVSDNRDLNTANNYSGNIAMTVKPKAAAGTGGGGNGNGNGTPAAKKCKAPKLSGKTLGDAKSLITKANCKLGKVTKPKKKVRKGYHLVVSKQSPKPGVTSAAGKKIDVTLKSKKKPKKKKK